MIATAGSLGSAWASATVALGLHVADEAAHDFLSWYNPGAERVRRALGGLPFPPTFTFMPWLAGLIVAVVALSALTPLAYAERPWIRPLAGILAAIHVANGLMHLVASLLARRQVPGVWSAPLLVITGIWLAYAADRLQ